MKRVKIARTEHPGVALDFDQVARFRELGEILYAAGTCRLWFALFTAVSIGLRRGEVMGLRWRDIDFEKNLIHVRQNLTSPGGKMVMRPTKTEAGLRDILMPPSLRAALQRQNLAQQKELLTSDIKIDEDTAVFATVLGKYTHPDNLDRALKGIIQWSDTKAVPKKKRKTKKQILAMGEASSVTVKKLVQTSSTIKISSLERRMKAIPRQHRAALNAVIHSGEPLPLISPHDLRHTAGTLMLRRKVPIEVVSKTLGHADISLTYRVYRHVLESERREHVVDLFEMALPTRAEQSLPAN